MTTFPNPLAEEIWRTRYRFQPSGEAPEASIDASWARVARALAAVEGADRSVWESRFGDALADFRFLPGGRILAGAGTGRRVTLFNCFVMGQIDDSMDGIFQALRIDCVDDYGAYLQFGTGTHGNALSQIVGPYRIQHVQYFQHAILRTRTSRAPTAGSAPSARTGCSSG